MVSRQKFLISLLEATMNTKAYDSASSEQCHWITFLSKALVLRSFAIKYITNAYKRTANRFKPDLAMSGSAQNLKLKKQIPSESGVLLIVFLRKRKS